MHLHIDILSVQEALTIIALFLGLDTISFTRNRIAFPALARESDSLRAATETNGTAAAHDCEVVDLGDLVIADSSLGGMGRGSVKDTREKCCIYFLSCHTQRHTEQQLTRLVPAAEPEAPGRSWKMEAIVDVLHS